MDVGEGRDAGLIPDWGLSPGEGHGHPLQYSCLENPMDRGAWRAYSPKGCKELDATGPFTTSRETGRSETWGKMIGGEKDDTIAALHWCI